MNCEIHISSCFASSAFGAVEVECVPEAQTSLKYFYIRPLVSGQTAGKFFPSDWAFPQPMPKGQILEEQAGGRSELVLQGLVHSSVRVQVILPWDYLEQESYRCSLYDEAIGPRK